MDYDLRGAHWFSLSSLLSLLLLLAMEVIYLIFELQMMLMRNDEVLERQRYDFELMVNVHERTWVFYVDAAEEMTMMTMTWPWTLVAFVHRHHTEYNKVNDDARISMSMLAVLLMEKKANARD